MQRLNRLIKYVLKKDAYVHSTFSPYVTLCKIPGIIKRYQVYSDKNEPVLFKNYEEAFREFIRLNIINGNENILIPDTGYKHIEEIIHCRRKIIGVIEDIIGKDNKLYKMSFEKY